jgi:magnesium transporter
LAQRRYPASYAYVVDAHDHLVGVVNMRDLMLAAPESRLSSVMRSDVFALHSFLDREEAANELSKRRYFAAPVIDHENRILGIIKGEQLMQGIQEESAEDIQILFGAGRDERAFSSLLYSLKKRLPWLHVNLATAFLAAGVVALFEGMIAKLTVLAVFLPVVAGQGGNAGAQSLAVVMRGLVMHEIPSGKVLRLVGKETLLGAVSGAVFGLLTAAVAWVWYGNPYLGVVAGLGMLVNLVFAGLAGASIPILMHRMGLDPAQCSSIILTTVTDIVGFFAFLGFAVVFQHYLV